MVFIVEEGELDLIRIRSKFLNKHCYNKNVFTSLHIEDPHSVGVWTLKTVESPLKMVKLDDIFAYNLYHRYPYNLEIPFS